MIPRRKIPPRPEPVAKADDAPPVEHRAVDLDVMLSNGATLNFSFVDGDGTYDEQPDRLVIEQYGERVELFRSAIIGLRRRERTFTTEVPVITPPAVR